jgi:hypothetical protein
MAIEVRQHHLARFIAQRHSRVVIEINHLVLLLMLLPLTLTHSNASHSEAAKD